MKRKEKDELSFEEKKSLVEMFTEVMRLLKELKEEKKDA